MNEPTQHKDPRVLRQVRSRAWTMAQVSHLLACLPEAKVEKVTSVPSTFPQAQGTTGAALYSPTIRLVCAQAALADHSDWTGRMVIRTGRTETGHLTTQTHSLWPKR